MGWYRNWIEPFNKLSFNHWWHQQNFPEISKLIREVVSDLIEILHAVCKTSIINTYWRSQNLMSRMHKSLLGSLKWRSVKDWQYSYRKYLDLSPCPREQRNSQCNSNILIFLLTKFDNHKIIPSKIFTKKRVELFTKWIHLTSDTSPCQ